MLSIRQDNRMYKNKMQIPRHKLVATKELNIFWTLLKEGVKQTVSDIKLHEATMYNQQVYITKTVKNTSSHHQSVQCLNFLSAIILDKMQFSRKTLAQHSYITHLLRDVTEVDGTCLMHGKL